MKRRRILTAAAALAPSLVAGCTDGGIFAGSGGTPHVDTTPLPDLSAANRVPDEAVTTVRIAWRAIGARRFDVDPNDGHETTAPTGWIYVVLGYAATNVGETPVEFDPGWISLRTPAHTYAPEALTHLTAFHGFPINPGDARGGWVAYLIPAETRAAVLEVTRWAPDEPFGVAFEHDPSVALPF